MLLIAMLAITSCTATHLVYVQESSLGLNVGASTEGTNKISLGWDRDVYAIVPKKKNTEDAMSLISVNRVRVSGVRDIEASEFVAGGTPATKLATDNQAIGKLRKKIYSEGN
tara:strand:- start:272 stop:607 length:336 start_codon:yes stop_codon:yes gene_type:complete